MKQTVHLGRREIDDISKLIGNTSLASGDVLSLAITLLKLHLSLQNAGHTIVAHSKDGAEQTISINSDGKIVVQ